ncbi:hypothetical protein [Bradyrhizobium sp. RT9a]|uniref:hypothetical protein n=1 Tax=Bradyrhizobium sp. RT9a TaxID=3156384 RepID=UPI0033982B35
MSIAERKRSGSWVTLEVERVLLVDRGRTVVLCDRDVVGREGGTILVKLKPAVDEIS